MVQGTDRLSIYGTGEGPSNAKFECMCVARTGGRS